MRRSATRGAGSAGRFDVRLMDDMRTASAPPPTFIAMAPHQRPLSPHAFDVLLGAGLQAHRSGLLHEGLGPRHPRLAAWLQRRWLQPVLGTLGDAVPPAQRRLFALRCVLVWALSQLRPDRQP